jgi:FemAB-related protein (PEP-CTERM system-associated)
VGVLPTAEIWRPFSGAVLSSLPYVNYGGVLASSGIVAQALIDHVATRIQTRQFSSLVLRHRKRIFSDLPVRSHKQTMLLALADSPDTMWLGLDRKVRNQIRKAEKSGLTAVTGGEELVDDFYGVFARNMRDLGTPVYGRALFAEMVQGSAGAIRYHVVRHDGRTVAAAVSHRYGDVVEVPSASSLREHRASCPNHLLYWHIIKSSIQERALTLDFGRSTPGDGTCHFKEQWGAVPEQLEWEYVLGPGQEMPTADRHDSKFEVLIRAWKWLPVPVATMLGPHLVRVVP